MALGRHKGSSYPSPLWRTYTKKLAAALIASLFATGAFAQASAPATTAPAPTAAPKANKHKVRHHKTKPVVLDKSKLGKASLQ